MARDKYFPYPTFLSLLGNKGKGDLCVCVWGAGSGGGGGETGEEFTPKGLTSGKLKVKKDGGNCNR